MHVISKRCLREFWEKHADARSALQSWYEDASRAEWKTPTELKSTYRNASILPDNRVVFNIKGNAYRLVVKVQFNLGLVYIRFVGTHQEYDRIDATRV